MRSARQEIVVNAPREKFYEVLVDFESYAAFIPEIAAVRLLDADVDRYRVEFEVELIKHVRYVLDMRGEPPERLSWSLVASNLLAENRGAWTLFDEGEGRTRAVYDVTLEVRQFVPGAILTKLVNVSLPKLLRRYKGRAESLA